MKLGSPENENVPGSRITLFFSSKWDGYFLTPSNDLRYLYMRRNNFKVRQGNVDYTGVSQKLTVEIIHVFLPRQCSL